MQNNEPADIFRQLGEGRIASPKLFQDRKELIIEHDTQEYRLRITATGKLILTK